MHESLRIRWYTEEPPGSSFVYLCVLSGSCIGLFLCSKTFNFAALTLVVGRGYPNPNGSCLHFGASILGWFHLQT